MEDHADAVLDALEVQITGLHGTPAFPAAKVFHYTAEGALHGIIESKTFLASHFTQTNDSTELQVADNVIIDVVADAWRTSGGGTVEETIYQSFMQDYPRLRAAKHMDVHLACFSEAPDDLNQWVKYGDGAAGVCLEFDLRKLGPLVEPATSGDAGMIAAPVVYRGVLQKRRVREVVFSATKLVAEALERNPQFSHRILIRALTCLFRLAATFAVQFKNRSFASEREWRLAIISKPGAYPGSFVIPFWQHGRNERVPLEGVTLGPLCDAEALDRVSSYLAASGYSDVPVSRSTIPLRRSGVQ